MAHSVKLFRSLLGSSAVLATSAMAAVPAVAQTTPASPMVASPLVTGAWQRVVQAQTWQQQAHDVNAFLTALATEGRRPADLTFDARDIASGRAVPADDPALLQRPQAHEVTLTVDGRFYVFRPLSRASIEPLLRR